MSDKKVIPIGGGGGGGESVIVDSELNASSTNPVQNKAITNALNNKANKATTLAGYGIGDAYTKSEVDSIKNEVETSATNKVTTHNASTTAHSDIRNLISELATRLNALANSDDTTLDQMAEVVAYIKSNRGLIEGITTAKANKDYVDEELAKKANAASLAKVATSGSYADLSNKPTIPTTLPANGGNADTVNGHTVEADVPANAEFTDTKYTLPNATSSVLGGVKVGANISVSDGTISVANGSTSAKGVVQLTNSTSSTSTTTAATPASVKSAYDLAKGKQSPATTLAGYGIGDAYTKSEVDSIKNEVETSATNKVTTHNASTTAHSDIRNLISELATRLNALANSDDTTLDQMAEVVAYIKSNRGLIEGITTAKANKDYVDEELAKKANAASLAKVATSGSYADLSNKPTIPTTLPANGGNADTVNGHTVEADVPANAEFTDTKYTLPNATSSVLGGVKVGANISVSDGTISVANGSTSAKGVVQLTNSTSSTSTTTAATPASVKSAYDLAKGKQSPATTLAGYGIGDAYTKTEVDSLVGKSLAMKAVGNERTRASNKPNYGL